MGPPFLALAALLALGGTAARAQDGPAIETPADPPPASRKAPARQAPAKAPAKTVAKVPANPKAVAPLPEAGVRSPAPTFAAPPPVPAAPRADLTVACAEKAALYEGPKNFSVWVTRTGLVVIENPLRPLTPETSRVLQVAIAGKVATAYGPDLFALRRGGAPAALEGATGGTIRWDATPTPLPDTLNIVSEAGQPLAQLAFQSCGEAPVIKAAPVGKAKTGSAKTGSPKTNSSNTATRPKTGGSTPEQGSAPPGLRLPSSAIEP